MVKANHDVNTSLGKGFPWRKHWPRLGAHMFWLGWKILDVASLRGNNKAEMHMKSVQLKMVNSFKYSGNTLSKNGSGTADLQIRIMIAAMVRLNRIWCSITIIFADTEMRIQIFGNKYLRGCSKYPIDEKPMMEHSCGTSGTHSHNTVKSCKLV